LKKCRVYGLVVLVVCLTFLSLKAQFRCWNTLFGKETAVIASAVFEIIRLGSLFVFLQWSGKRKVVGIALYTSIAVFCGSLGVLGWFSTILEAHQRQEAMEKEKTLSIVAEIKSRYAKKIQMEINILDRMINSVEEKMELDTNSTYLPKRKGELLARESALVRDRDRFLSEQIQNFDAWIQKAAAIVDLKIASIQSEDLRLVSVENAVMKMWYVKNVDTAKKIMATVLVCSIEANILLLSLILSLMMKSSVAGDRDVTRNDGIVGYLTERFDENDIKMFIRKCRDKYDKQGALPKSFELTAKLRPLRQAIMENGFGDKALKELFGHYQLHLKSKSIEIA